MGRRVPTKPLLYDLEIERRAQRNNSIKRRLFKEAQEVSSTTVESTTNFSDHANIQPSDDKEEVDMVRTIGGQRTLEDYATLMGPLNFNSIVKPTIIAPNMEMKYALIDLVQSNQFHGLSHENPYNHLATFSEICNMMKIN